MTYCLKRALNPGRSRSEEVALMTLDFPLEGHPRQMSRWWQVRR
jgi:hypothetical protein